MSTSQQIANDLPYLRRYARALTGNQKSGDAYVRATLEAALQDKDLLSKMSSGRVALYGAFNKIWLSSHEEREIAESSNGGLLDVADARLARVTPQNRQALLLSAIENFSHEEIAAVMEISASEVTGLIAEAMAEIQSETATDVLIIEDEALISMQLEQLVQSLGHRVTGIAATRDEVRELVEKQEFGLVLADIQLADGSSGIDAVNDIFVDTKVPVIFITAFPEKLLTGERPEPTYLITKPFQEATVLAAISQAMFFGTTEYITSAA